MRVIAGRYGGRRLADPPGAGVRPTSDRVREARFSALGDVSGLRVLDLFAGTGALGIEALSRGATCVVFVDQARASVGVLRRNLRELGLDTEPETALVVRADTSAAIRRMGRAGERFDLVFLDPPYDSEQAQPALEALMEADLVDADGEVVLEASRRHSLPSVAGLALLEERRYGDTLIARFQPVGQGAQQEAEPV
jgi:16S rRNA (guanine966-N2)-methyltransferase